MAKGNGAVVRGVQLPAWLGAQDLIHHPGTPEPTHKALEEMGFLCGRRRPLVFAHPPCGSRNVAVHSHGRLRLGSQLTLVSGSRAPGLYFQPCFCLILSNNCLGQVSPASPCNMRITMLVPDGLISEHLTNAEVIL